MVQSKENYVQGLLQKNNNECSLFWCLKPFMFVTWPTAPWTFEHRQAISHNLAMSLGKPQSVAKTFLCAFEETSQKERTKVVHFVFVAFAQYWTFKFKLKMVCEWNHKISFILFLLLSKDLNFLVHFHRHETPMIGRILFDEIERRAKVWFPRKSIFFAHHVYQRIQHPVEYMASPDVPLGFKGVWK